MLIDRLQQENLPLPASASPPTSPSLSVQNPQIEKQKSEDPAIADQVLVSEKGDAKLRVMGLQNERQNDAATAIRDTDKKAQELGQKIDQLKAPLQVIMKNFPPFAPQDKERVKLLMSYTSIRKEIDELTVPPPPDVVEARKKQVALPEPLSPHADDSQIADHVDKLDAAAQSLESMREDVAARTASFVADGRFTDIFSAPKGAQAQVSEPIGTDAAAAQKSAEVGRQFAETVSQGVTLTRPQYLKGLS